MHKRVIGVVALLLLFSMAIPISQTFAESLDVSAQVNASLPPGGETPVVQAPGNNSTVDVQNVFITGQCYIIDPTLIVVLLRDNQVIGTGPCLPDGTFRILVGLVRGVNIIVPKYVTITGQSGGYGQPITLLYNQSEITTAPQTQQSPDGQSSRLKITLNYDFITYNDTSPTQITYTVTGGKGPYIVTINWGDGTQTTAKITSNEPQSSKHQYDRVLPPASLTITVVDSADEKVVQSRGLVSFKKGLYVPAVTTTDKPSGISTVQKIWLCVAIISVVLLLMRHFGYLAFLPDKTIKKPAKKGKKR
jgi:hypothetical protein